MGCRVSSHDSLQNLPSENTENMHRYNTDEVDFKSRLERKICVAKETPEPVYDLADCNLKEIPHGVFIMCRILLKEQLNLSNNKLHNFTNGSGSLKDLNILQVLDLSFNKIKKIPNDIYYLENLRQLNLSNNQIDILPSTIRELKKLEFLDLSHNKLISVDKLSLMPCLRILNIKNNNKLTKLPYVLTTCYSLIDIILDADNFVFPPKDVTNKGTLDILQYIASNTDNGESDTKEVKELTERFISAEKFERHNVEKVPETYSKEKFLIEHERAAQEKDYMLEAQLHIEQQKKKQQLLEQLLHQQNETEIMVNDLQKAKELERNQLLSDILQEEEYSNMIVNNLLCLKNGQDEGLIEKEKQEQEQLMEKLRIHQCELRKQEILSAMTDLLENETITINLYNSQRETESRNLIEQEMETNKILETVFIDYDKNRSEVIDEIKQNDELQKSAVAALIAMNDARTWGLMEQVRIVESQLAKMTYYEIEKRKISSEEAIDELSEGRINLTFLLLDLLDQQEKRRLQLFETVRYIEEQNEENRKDYWLIQYQKLIDTHPADITSSFTAIDPLLGYNFLVNGVVHCLPFLLKIWQTKAKQLYDISDIDLQEAGIQKEMDRKNILKSIKEFLNDNMENESSTSQLPVSPTPSTSDNTSKKDDLVSPRQLTECVICMENECQIIFLPCGHLCCCIECQKNLIECPICRGKLERRIKVIRP